MRKHSLSKTLIGIVAFLTYTLLFFHSESSGSVVSWKKHFIKNDSEIPMNKYRVFYFDERTSGVVKHQEEVEIPSIHYVRENFRGIDAEHIGAYYIGKFSSVKTKTVNFNVFQGRADSAIFVDGEKIWEGSKYSHSTEFSFTAGEHIIEIQYVSRHFSASFMVTMTDFGIDKNHEELSRELLTKPISDIWYCGIYESGNFENIVNISLENNKGSLVLFLASYEPVIWNFSQVNNINLRSVIIHSKHPKSIVKNINKDVKIHYIDYLPWVYDTYKTSSGDKKNTFKNLVYNIQGITKKKPSGFSGKYALSNVTIPEKILDASFYQTIGMRLDAKPNGSKNKKKSKLERVFE